MENFNFKQTSQLSSLSLIDCHFLKGKKFLIFCLPDNLTLLNDLFESNLQEVPYDVLNNKPNFAREKKRSVEGDQTEDGNNKKCKAKRSPIKI